MGDSRIGYDRDEGLSAALDREASSVPDVGTPAMLLKTISEGSYPTAAQRVYACEPATVSAEPAEGASPSLSSGGLVYAANAGANVPPVDTYVIASRAGGVWVFVY